MTGWLVPTPAHLRALLEQPELALVAESCDAECRLHAALHDDPAQPVDPVRLAAIADADARSNYATWLGFRDALVAAGTFEAYYLALMRSGRVDVPPVFVARVVEAIAAQLVAASDDPFERRAAQLLHRPQRLTIERGRVLAADLDAADRAGADAEMDIVGSLLRPDAVARAATLPVLGTDNAERFTADGDPPAYVLDLTHEITNDVGHGLGFRLTRAHSGLAALARVLARWVEHFTGAGVTIRPLQRIDDDAWRWHIGLDVEASAILDDLYRGADVDAARLERLIGLFRLDFANAAEMRADVAGKPVWLGMAMNDARTLKLKPQNLLLNLPLAAAM